MKIISKYRKYRITTDIPKSGVTGGMVFEWDAREDCFVTKSLPRFQTPLVTRSQIRRKMFELVKF